MKITFSKIDSESNNALLWKVTPILLRNSSFWKENPLEIFSLSININPLSGFKSPNIHFNKTDLPDPEEPIITKDSPFDKFKLILSSTFFSPKLFCLESQRFFPV